ncbi:Zinc finger, C6HC-type [Penicillium digitatum]|uniref:Zinc finger, C6HC-type n=1 Tax=Penicillium digitatum TaxID=36651 RepID=A0A7T6XEY9_PENDI|nr:Zinc finger, C6HC-type [Penicillium digitatum]
MANSRSSIRQLLEYMGRAFKFRKFTEEVGLCTGCYQKVPTCKLFIAPSRKCSQQNAVAKKSPYKHSWR